ncbi:hypothetical protein [Nostoc sp.]|uniref:hypothetical protein n=1 Tax=Nostoc sp. TaxID=1180 RepID=UPI002FFCF955
MAVPSGCVCRSFNIPEGIDNRLHEIALDRRATITSLLVAALENFIDKHDAQVQKRKRIRKEAA